MKANQLNAAKADSVQQEADNMYNNVYLNTTAAFEDLYDIIMQYGEDTNIGTKALYDVGILIINPEERVIKTPWRNFSESYAEREWNWYLSGNRSVEELKKYAPIWDKMHSGDNIVNSNYGWQWTRNGQLHKCIEQLKNNPGTRQAWISIFDGKEKDDYKFDTPCTLSIGFDVKADKLNMTVLMRSNDLVYGFCNDTYCFSKLQKMVADALKLKIGKYYHFAHDMHIYTKHFNLKSK